MCPELQYTKDRNENINQVKTQQATMNQNVSWTPIYKGQEWKYQSGKNTASYYEPKCVLNEGCVHHLHMKQVEVERGEGGEGVWKNYSWL